MVDRPYESMHEVVPGIYVGGYLAAANPVMIQTHNIGGIIKMFADDPTYEGGAYHHPGVRKRVFDADDVPEYDIRADLKEAYKTICEWQNELLINSIAAKEQRPPKNILVHCHAGISRSVSVVLLYLMMKEGMGLDEALATVRRVRPFAGPNAGFMKHLQATEDSLRRLRALPAHA